MSSNQKHPRIETSTKCPNKLVTASTQRKQSTSNIIKEQPSQMHGASKSESYNKFNNLGSHKPDTANRQQVNGSVRSSVNSNNVQSSETKVNVANSLNRNTAFLEAKGKKIQALVDSRASVSCLQNSTFDRLNKDNSLTIHTSNVINIVGVGGECHEVFGPVKITLNISGLNVGQNFIVISQLHHPLILSLDFMKTYQVHIDFNHKIMTIGNDAVIVALACDSKYGYARCIRKETLEPGHFS